MTTTNPDTAATAKPVSKSARYHIVFTADRLHPDVSSAQYLGDSTTGEPVWLAQVSLTEGYSDWSDVANILTIAHPYLDNITPIYAQNGTDTRVSRDAAVHWF